MVLAGLQVVKDRYMVVAEARKVVGSPQEMVIGWSTRV